MSAAPVPVSADPTALPPAPRADRSAPAGHAVSARARHIPALDGVRGLAIALVLLHHGYLPMPSATGPVVLRATETFWMGVDLFFVLSGFLITGILLDTLGRPGALRAFYARRVRRILPLYYVVLVAFAALVPLIDPAHAARVHWLMSHTGWLWTHTWNIYLAWQGSWSTAGSIDHLWSLAVEEQFYAVWPFILLAVPRRFVGRVCVGLLLTSLLLRLALTARGTSGVVLYVSMPTRLDGFMVGAWLANAMRDERLWPRVERSIRWLAAGGAPVLLACAGALTFFAVLVSGRTMHTVGFTVLALAFGALVAAAVAAGPNTTLVRVSSAPALRMLGRYSYAIYLVHPLVLVGLQTLGLRAERIVAMLGGPMIFWQTVIVIAMSAVSFALAALSWHVLEGPLLRRRAAR